MQQFTIQSQVETIKKATEIASKTKESALKFLIEAGIIKKEEAISNKKNSSSTAKK